MEEEKRKTYIDTEDLYGPSDLRTENGQTVQDQERKQETTVFRPEPDAQQGTADNGLTAGTMPKQPDQHPTLDDPLSRPELPKAPSSLRLYSVIGTFFVFFIIFIVGFIIGGVLKGYTGEIRTELFGTTPNDDSQSIPAQSDIPSPTSRFVQEEDTDNSFGGFVAYEVISGANGQAVPGITYKLPASVLRPTCNGSECSSQGTYLPGGTRFTVAIRGAGEPLGGYTEGSIVDGNGRAFDMEQTTIQGYPAVTYIGEFEGSALGGYSFSRMRGVMVMLSDEKTLELNHFNPSGVIADYEGDDAVFDEILASITVDNILYSKPTTNTTL